MPLRFQNVCRHRQTNNTGRLPPILTLHTLFSHFPAALLSSLPTFPENLLPAVSRRPAPHALFPHLSCPASFKLSRLSRKSPASRLPPILTPHTLFSHFPAPLLSNFPAFLENLLPAVSCRPAPHTLFSRFPAALLSSLPTFPENLLPAVSRRPAPHALFPHLSCPASFKLSRLSRKSPASRLPPILTPHTLFSHFPAPLLSNFPAFLENLLPAVSCRPAPHTLFSRFPAALLSSLPTFPENLLPAVSRRPAPHALFPCFLVLFTAPLPDVFVSSF